MSGGEKSRVSLLRSTLLFYRRNTSPLNNQSSSSGESEASIGYTSSSHHRSSAPSLDSDRLPSQSASSGKTVRIGTSSSEKNQETREMESKPRRHVSAGRKKSRSYSPGGGNSNAPQKHDLPPSDPKNNSHSPIMEAKSPNAVIFVEEFKQVKNRPPPELPTTAGIDYPRAASWSSSTVAEILKDPLGRQMFRCFLSEAFAEENLFFVDELDSLRKEKSDAKIREGIAHLIEIYGQIINLSSVAMNGLKEVAKEDSTFDKKPLDIAFKEIYKFLENDQFPRFRRSKIYLGYLEQLLPKAYAERWTTSFDALLGNQVGRHHFREFLVNVHAEENLRFWESVVEFRATKNKSTAMLNMGRQIQQQFLREGAPCEVFLPFGLRQRIEKKLRGKDVDETLFDDSVKHVEQILKNDPYVRFLQSKEYNELLERLH